MSDAEKQNAMDVFLGVYQPAKEKLPIWDKELNEIYLHLNELCEPYDRNGYVHCMHATYHPFS